MKRILYCICIIMILTIIMIVYVHKNYPDSIAELCISEYMPAEEIREAIDKTGVYDYAVVFGLFSKEENANVYFGNINTVTMGRIRENSELELSSSEVIMGDKFAQKAYAYYPLGQNHISVLGEYKINGIINGSNAIYYNDLKILERGSIKNQRLYVVLKDKDNKSIDENMFISQVKSYGVPISSFVCYGDIKRLLVKVLILLSIGCIILAAVKLLRIIRRKYTVFTKGYDAVRNDLYFRQYVFQGSNIGLVGSIVLSVSGIIMLWISTMLLTVKYMNIPMPYKVNPVSPKSIYEAISSFIDMMDYYMKNGMTEISKLMLGLVVLYGVAVVTTLIGASISYWRSLCQNYYTI